MFGKFRKKTALRSLTEQLDSFPDFMTSIRVRYGSGQEGDLYHTILQLKDPAIFEEAKQELEKSPVNRRLQLYAIQWAVACRTQDVGMRQWLIDAYYRETDDRAAHELRQYISHRHMSHLDAPPPFRALEKTLDLRGCVTDNPRYEARYLELACVLFFEHHKVFQHDKYENFPPENIDFHEITTRLMKAELLPREGCYHFFNPFSIGAIGAYSGHMGMLPYLMQKLDYATDKAERFLIAQSIAHNFPLTPNDEVTRILLETATKRGENQRYALKALRFAPKAEVEDFLIDLLKSDKLSLDSTRVAVGSLGVLASEKALPYIATLMEHSKRDVRWSALAALPRTGEWLAYWIHTMDKDRDPFLKGYAMTGLLEVATPEVRAAILKFARKAAKLKDNDKNLTIKSYLPVALKYLTLFPEDAEAASFLATLSPEILKQEISPEAHLTGAMARLDVKGAFTRP